MSLTLATNSALSNIINNQKQSSLISRNIAGAGVEGYVRKDLAVHSRIVNGVNIGTVASVQRHVDERLISNVRSLSSDVSALSSRAELLSSYTNMLGQPQDALSVSSRLSDFKIAIQDLAGRPSEASSQQAVAKEAERLANSINGLYSHARDIRHQSEQKIQGLVKHVNENLVQMENLNKEIVRLTALGQDSSDLRDERDRVADSLAKQIGVSTYERDSGEMVVMTRTGVTLVETSANLLTATPFGGLRTEDGIDLTPTGGSTNAITSGEIAGLFQVRDEDMPRYQAQLDQLAAGLIQAFEEADQSVTGTPPADTGLFTDGGASFDPANLAGMADRLQINDLVNEKAGGAHWRISAGMHATDPASGGDASQAEAFLQKFLESRTYADGLGVGSSGTLENYATNITSIQHSDRASVENTLESRMVSLNALETTRLNQFGVNVDEQLQRLMDIEQSFSASAMVLQVASSMVDSLLNM